jgi:hypothetical protein
MAEPGGHLPHLLASVGKAPVAGVLHLLRACAAVGEAAEFGGIR